MVLLLYSEIRIDREFLSDSLCLEAFALLCFCKSSLRSSTYSALLAILPIQNSKHISYAELVSSITSLHDKQVYSTSNSSILWKSYVLCKKPTSSSFLQAKCGVRVIAQIFIKQHLTITADCAPEIRGTFRLIREKRPLTYIWHSRSLCSRLFIRTISCMLTRDCIWLVQQLAMIINLWMDLGQLCIVSPNQLLRILPH